MSPSPLPQPSDATELVERLNVLGARFGRGEVIGGTPYAVQCWHDLIRAADFITQLQARATAAEGEIPSREEIARVIDPDAWRFRDTAVAPYERQTGATGDEGWIYEVTWRKGFRSVAQVEDWLYNGPPEPSNVTQTAHWQFQQSLTKADAILALRKPSSDQQTITQLTRELENREKLGEMIYLAMYGPDGAIWAANESKPVWYAIADRFAALYLAARP